MPGFDFSNHTRNAALHARGVPLPKATSTGTTIVGCIFDGGVVVSNAWILPRTVKLSIHRELLSAFGSITSNFKLRHRKNHADFIIHRLPQIPEQPVDR